MSNDCFIRVSALRGGRRGQAPHSSRTGPPLSAKRTADCTQANESLPDIIATYRTGLQSPLPKTLENSRQLERANRVVFMAIRTTPGRQPGQAASFREAL